jgi:hypothetical protein
VTAAPSVVRIKYMAGALPPHNQKYSILRFGGSVLDLRVHIVCLKHEDLSTAKIAERYVAGWVSTRGYHGPPGNKVAAASP